VLSPILLGLNARKGSLEPRFSCDYIAELLLIQSLFAGNRDARRARVTCLRQAGVIQQIAVMIAVKRMKRLRRMALKKKLLVTGEV
jgi:hypothetical protein